MRKDALRYIADTIAIESLASDLSIQKHAGLFEELDFPGVATSITSKVKSLLVEDDSPGGWIKAIGNILITGALFKAHWLLGIVYAFANALGLDLVSIGKRILSGISDAIKGGASAVLSSVDYHGKIAIKVYNETFVKDAQLFGKQAQRGNTKAEGLFSKLLSAGKISSLKTLLVAILIWALKTALIGAGLVGGAGFIASFIKGKPNKTNTVPVAPEVKSETEQMLPNESILPTPKESIDLIPSGRGTEQFKNDQEEFVWIVPIIGDLKETLVAWAVDIYPELSEYEDIIYSSQAFSNVLYEFSKNDTGTSSIRVPGKYTSRKQIVDTFVGDVARKIKGMT